jgi:hypothetical protein
MKFKRIVLGSLMLACAPLAALADDMSYSYVDLAYVETDIDGVGQSADGIAARGSVGFAEHYFAFGEFVSESVQNVDLDTITVGLGGHYGLAENLDLVGKLGWFSVDLSGGGANFDDDGYLLDLGLRGRVADSVELEGGVRYTDLGGANGDDTAFYFGGRYHFNDMWAVGAEYQSGDDSSSWLAGVRISF